jgi:hypothetical protein
VFNIIEQIIDWFIARDIGQYEAVDPERDHGEGGSVRLWFLRIGVYYCLVLDHCNAVVEVTLPRGWRGGYRTIQGDEPVAESGFFLSPLY